MERKQNVLFLSARNGVRSQMAQALMHHHAGDRYNAVSAGFEPGEVHPNLKPVMDEAGIDISDLEAKGLKQYLARILAHHCIIIGAEEEEDCPTSFPAAPHVVFWRVKRPVSRKDHTDEQQLEDFRRIRDDLTQRVQKLIAELDAINPADEKPLVSR